MPLRLPLPGGRRSNSSGGGVVVGVPPPHDGQRVAEAPLAGRALVVVVRELVELVLGQEVVVQHRAREGRVRGARGDGEEGCQRGAKVGQLAAVLHRGRGGGLGGADGRGGGGGEGLVDEGFAAEVGGGRGGRAGGGGSPWGFGGHPDALESER